MRRALVTVACFALAACGGGGGNEAEPTVTTASTTSAPTAQPPGAGADASSGDLTVFAAASLTDAFQRIGATFSESNAEVEVSFNLGPSNGLAAQIVEGAPADVFASAHEAQMDLLAEAGLLAEEPMIFATNALEIIVEPGNPQDIRQLADLARPDLVVVMAAPEVPAGQYAAEMLARANVEVTPASLEPDVRSVVSRVALGEADAGIAYVSDAVAFAGQVEGIAIGDDVNAAARYPIAVVDSGPNRPAAEAFVAFVLSEEGRQALAGIGFSPP